MVDEEHLEEAPGGVTATAAAALHGILDASGPPPGAGDPVPPLWHWLAFLPTAAQRGLGTDGHPASLSYLRNAPLGRRMVAGGRVDFTAPAAIGAPLHRVSRTENVAEKLGRSGKLVFVDIRHDIDAEGRVAIREVQNLVYREAAQGSPTGPNGAPAPVDDEWTWRRTLATDSRLLFRFSALTYNAHRIHYDVEYARDVEGYPGIVAHGPLQAIALAEICRRELPSRRVRSFQFRSTAPAFGGDVLELRGRMVDEGRVELTVVDSSGSVTMQAQAVLEVADPPGGTGRLS